VYTGDQATRGKDVYAGACRSCHTPKSHTGATFNKYWKGKQVSDLFTFVNTRMPKNDPGSLDPGDVADVVAYLLQMNAMPTGPTELPADIDSLKKIRIDAKKAPTKAATSTAKKKKS
jgi:mono/diheme cytochrome c family protein